MNRFRFWRKLRGGYWQKESYYHTLPMESPVEYWEKYPNKELAAAWIVYFNHVWTSMHCVTIKTEDYTI